MNWSAFLRQLTKLTIPILLLGWVLNLFQDDNLTIAIYSISVSMFVLFSILMFLYAYNTSSSDNLFSYNNVVIVSFIIKLIMSFGVILFFEKTFQPHYNWHILHFIIVYLCYTVYEVYFLTRLAKTSE